jgi:DNA-binding FadR family transcriptional regulator
MDRDTRLHAIQLPRAADVVADTIRSRIIGRELEAGEPLPPEIQLMAEMGVARTTVREALRILESEGLLTVRRGVSGGARVRTPSVANVTRYIGLLLQYDGATLEDVSHARVLLEAPAAGLLAETVTPEIVAELRQALANEALAVDDPVERSHAHGRFHQTVVELTGSRTYEAVSAVANRIIQAASDQFFASSGDSTVKRGFAEAHRAHTRLVDLIASGAAQDAEAMWRTHLEAVDAYFMSSPGARSVLDTLE